MRGLKAAILGGVSSRVAARSRRPVVVVPPQGAHAFRLSLSERAPSVTCAVDDSEPSRLAARHGAELAAALGLRLVLVHVQGDRPLATRPATVGALPLYGADALELERRRGKDALERASEMIRSDLELALELVAGDPAHALARRAAGECAAVIAVGCRGRGPLTSLLLGSTSNRLAACAGRPVMIVSTVAAPPETGDPALSTSRASPRG